MRFPDPADLAAAYRFNARRYGWSGEPNLVPIASALSLAETMLTEHPNASAVALLCAFSSYPRAFPGGSTLMTWLIAENHAAGLGIRWDLTVHEKRLLRLDILQRRVTVAEVREFLATRERPIG